MINVLYCTHQTLYAKYFIGLPFKMQLYDLVINLAYSNSRR